MLCPFLKRIQFKQRTPDKNGWTLRSCMHTVDEQEKMIITMAITVELS
jgi:hypothetical protein